MKARIQLVILLSAGLALPAAAPAFVLWDNSSGVADYFTWSNGGSDNGLFGSPLLVGGNTFVFFPADFRAESAGGGQSTASDRLVVDLHAKPGVAFTAVQITEYGDYGIVGSGSVALTGALQLTDLNGGGQLGAALQTNPVFPVSSGNGAWSAAATVDVSSEFPEWTDLRFELQNDLLAVSDGQGSVAYIQKKVLGSAVAITFIPEPSALGLVLLGCTLLRRR